MSTRVKINPAYRDAPYQLNFEVPGRGLIEDPYAHRFNEPWPDDITGETLWAWVIAHSVPPRIEVNE